MARSRKVQKLTHDTPATGIAPSRLTRRALLLSCVVLCGAVVFGYAGEAWAAVLYRLLTDGAFLLAWLACAAGLGAAILLVLPVARDADGEERLLHLVTATAFGIGVFSLAALGLGLVGLLNRPTAFSLLAVGAALGLFALTRHRATTSASIQSWLRAPAGWSWLWLAAMPFLGLAIVAALLPPGVMWPSEPHPYDVVEYHLQIPREWYEIGRIVPLHHNAFSFFPFNVEMQYLLAMHLRGGPWAGMYLAHFMHLAMVALTVAAVYGFARRWSSTQSSATIAAVAAATVPWMTQLGSIAYNEGGLLLFGTLALGWAFRAVVSPSRRLGRFPVAGLMAGFACGCKLTAVPEILLAVGAIAAVAVLLDHRTSRVRSEAEPRIPSGAPPEEDIRVSAPLRTRLVEPVPVPLVLRLTGVATFVLAGLLAFAPWLIRNQIWAGNPVFPEAATMLGQAHFSDAQVQRWKQAHAPRPDQQALAARLFAWRTGVWTSPQYGYALIPLGIAAGLAALVRRHAVSPSSTPDSNVLKNIRIRVSMLLAMFVGLSVVWLGFTHLQGRFFILAVPIAALLLAHMPWGRIGATVVAAVVIVAGTRGYALLHAEVAERSAFVGFEELSEVFVPEAFARPLKTGEPVVLVGDAKAFVYPGPMSRVFYRTVFDVDVKPGETVIDAWSRGALRGAWRLVDPVELRRFHNTYASIPSLAPEYADRTEPFVIPPNPAVSSRAR